MRCAPAGRLMGGRGELLVGYRKPGLGGHGEGLRRSRGDTAGAKPGASPVDRAAVNVGTTRSALQPGR
jgi:hypothetical protein